MQSLKILASKFPPHIMVILYCKRGLLCKCRVGLTSEQDSVDPLYQQKRDEKDGTVLVDAQNISYKSNYDCFLF